MNLHDGAWTVADEFVLDMRKAAATPWAISGECRSLEGSGSPYGGRTPPEGSAMENPQSLVDALIHWTDRLDGVDGLILDLRHHGGGAVSSLARRAEFVLRRG